MQSSFDNGKPNLRRVDKNHYENIFSKISKEVKFFYPSSLRDKQYGRLGWLSLPSLLFSKNCLYKVKLSGCSRNCHSQSH